MPNNLKVGPNSVVPKQAISFAAAGFTGVNCDIIYKTGDPYISWVPGREFNPITAFELGDFGYHIVMKQAADMTAYLYPPVAGGVTPSDDPIESFPIANGALSNGFVNGTTGAGSVVASITSKTITKMQVRVNNASATYEAPNTLNFVRLNVKENNKDGALLATKALTNLGMPASGSDMTRTLDFTFDVPLVITGTKKLFVEYYCDLWSKELILPGENAITAGTGVFFESQLNDQPRDYTDQVIDPAEFTLWTKIFF